MVLVTLASYTFLFRFSTTERLLSRCPLKCVSFPDIVGFAFSQKYVMQIAIGKEGNIVHNKSKKCLFTDFSRATQARPWQAFFA